MVDVGIIFLAEFLRKIRSRPFIIGTIAGAFAIVGLSALPNLVSHALDTATRPIVLAGEPALVNAAARLLNRDYDVIARLPAPAVAPTLADLNANGKAAAYVVLARHADRLVVTAYARDPGYFGQTLVDDLVPLNIGLATGAPIAQIRRYFHVETKVTSLNAKFANPAAAEAARGVAYILVLLLYLAILLNSQTVMASVAEEKTSRIAEILVATTTPARLLTGKILAAGAIGLIQLGVWLSVGVGTGAAFFAASAVQSNHASTHIASGTNVFAASVMAAFIAFFLIGFMQYATLYAAAASLINRTEDLGSVAAPLVVPVIAGFFLAQYALAFPQSHNVALLSFVPLVSPFVMFTRMIVTAVPAWQVAASLIVNVAATVAIIWGAGKVYRVGLLLYGRPPSLKQVVAALRA